MKSRVLLWGFCSSLLHEIQSCKLYVKLIRVSTNILNVCLLNGIRRLAKLTAWRSSSWTMTTMMSLRCNRTELGISSSLQATAHISVHHLLDFHIQITSGVFTATARATVGVKRRISAPLGPLRRRFLGLGAARGAAAAWRRAAQVGADGVDARRAGAQLPHRAACQ